MLRFGISLIAASLVALSGYSALAGAAGYAPKNLKTIAVVVAHAHRGAATAAAPAPAAAPATKPG